MRTTTWGETLVWDYESGNSEDICAWILLAGSCHEAADGETGVGEWWKQTVSDETRAGGGGTKSDRIPSWQITYLFFHNPRDRSAVSQKVINESPVIRFVAKESLDPSFKGPKKNTQPCGYLWNVKLIQHSCSKQAFATFNIEVKQLYIVFYVKWIASES